MHAVIRTYSGSGAKQLFDLLDDRKSDLDSEMRTIPGFVSYLLVRTDDGGASVTVCEDKSGLEEGARRAKKWIAANAPDVQAPAPTSSEGSVIVQLNSGAPTLTAAVPLSTVS